MIKYLTLILILFASCTRENNRETIWVKGKVRETNFPCGKPSITFLEDSVKVKGFTGEMMMWFNVAGLRPDLNIKDKELYLRVARILPEESFACLAMDPTIPALRVMEAKER